MKTATNKSSSTPAHKSPSPRKIIVLGSTGSIGLSTLQVVREQPGAFTVEGLAANSSVDALAAQAGEFSPRVVAVGGNKHAAAKLQKKLGAKNIKILHGPEGVEKLAAWPGVERIVIGVSGAAGTRPALAAARAGKMLLIANKESLVAAGGLITAEAKKSGAQLLPLDSEHSAIFQCLLGQDKKAIRKLILTATGGPFLNVKNLSAITPERALRHPRWNMGPKVTIDSATLANKGLEIIEARWLFGVPFDKIEVLIHPQAIIHSMVEFTDGTVIAQMSNPDMKFPIGYAMNHPGRAATAAAGPDFPALEKLTFQKPDTKRFPCLDILREAGRLGGLVPAAVAAADEVAVEAFLKGGLPFTGIPKALEHVLRRCEKGGAAVEAVTLESVGAADADGRRLAAKFVKSGR